MGKALTFGDTEELEEVSGESCSVSSRGALADRGRPAGLRAPFSHLGFGTLGTRAETRR